LSGKRKAEQADVEVALVAAEARNHPIVRAAGALSELADQPPLITGCAAVCVVGVAIGNQRLARAGLRMLLAELLATAAKDMIKHRIDRSRPRSVIAGKPYRAEPGDEHESESNSFPSGHTAGAVAVARAFARDYPEHANTAYAIAAATGAVQVPRSAHYPVDVAAGAVIGLLSDYVVAAGGDLFTRLAAAAPAPRPAP
jgi:membrane-associated phospholipid phosphatase